MNRATSNTISAGPARRRRRGIALASIAALVLAGTAYAAPATRADAATRIPVSFEFDGAGWGHGVGMSQYGAKGRSMNGHSATSILEHYYAPADVTTSATYATSDIHVQLVKTGQTTITPRNGSLRIRVDGRWVVTGSPVVFTADGDYVLVSGGVRARGTQLDVEWQRTRAWPQGSGNTTVTVTGADAGEPGEYRHGRIRVGALDGQVNVLNKLRLNDEYLYGVDEMPSLWGDSALQSQVIAARTYAMRNKASFRPGCACHVFDDSRSQKFSGWEKESQGPEGRYGARWRAAVDATVNTSGGEPTSARVIVHNGGLIDAVYFSSSGGKTRAAASVWGTDVAYLQSRDDPESISSAVGNPYSTWSKTVPQATVAGAFGLGDVVEVRRRNGTDGAVSTATAVSSGGRTASISGVDLRNKLGLRSADVNAVDPVFQTYAVGRIHGPDRYATAAAVSRHGFPSGTDVVYVATGGDYADALVAAPAAAHDGAPLLLTRSASLPAETRTEIERLGPSRIVVVGGRGAVSDAVFAELDRLAAATRRGGADRYATAVEVSAGAFGSAADAYVATGANYPDALSASSVAAAQDRPVLLVRGSAGTVSGTTRDGLRRLGVDRVTVAGGPGAVSASLFDSLAEFSPVRRYGADRYATNRALNGSSTPGYATGSAAYLATGYDYPDALAGAAVAGKNRWSLYLSRTDCVPDATLAHLDASAARSVLLLGGTGVLSGDVAALKAC
ncbi:cell wall-binding repeat-containing protein [Zhihengliuella salsuginis]|uniref:Sporulation stage II protein D amidase enhancer LytB N-terminal domain-containing protein n=1 Tax=Zhihengliuella salsuginis TaxID=578222 RepID=A0ABQ3GI60_9MICC|nr:cell wall-binding repeat-containing protein [Zhihengliuella salsuginis]GHD08283.1 hypothetical protein GCM10008096_19780 [Zhihengliuella salsuginis]